MSTAADNSRQLVAHLNELRSVKTDLVEALKGELERLQLNCRRKEAEIERLLSVQSKMSSSLELSNRQAKEYSEKVKTLEIELGQLREQYTHVLKQIEQYTELVQDLKKKFDLTIKTVEADFENKKALLSSQSVSERAEIENRDKALNVLQFQLAKIGNFSEDQAEQINYLSAKISEANETINRLEAANESLKADNLRLQDSLHKSGELSEQVTDLQRDLSEKAQEFEDLKDELVRARASSHALEAEKSRTEQLLKSSRTEALEIEQRLELREAAIQSELNEKNTELTELKSQVERLASENDRLQIKMRESEAAADAELRELQLRIEYRASKISNREHQVALQEKQNRRYSFNLIQQKKTFLKDVKQLAEATFVAIQTLPLPEDSANSNKIQDDDSVNYSSSVDTFNAKVQIDKLLAKRQALNEFFKEKEVKLKQLSQVLSSATNEIETSIENDADHEKSELEILDKKVEDLHVENMNLKADLAKAQFHVNTQARENEALNDSREAALAAHEKHIQLREMQLTQYTHAITEHKAEILLRAKLLADEVASFSKMHPLKDYLRMTEFELSRAEIQLKSTPSLSVDRQKYQKIFENLMEQKMFLTKVIAETESKLASQSQQLLELIRNPKISSSPSLPPPFLPRSSKPESSK